MEHAGHGEDWDDVGYGYEALVGRPGESQGFNISWAQFLRPRDMERKLILEPGDPGYVSFEEVQATEGSLRGTITVDSRNKKGDLVRNQVHPTYISVPY